MFAYCVNNPVNQIDPCGHVPVIAALVCVGIVLVGEAKNVIDSIYYAFSDGESDLTSDSYTDEFLSHWEKLDYTKQQTGEEHYNSNAQRYYSEYTLHEYGWYLTGWSYNYDIYIVTDIAQRCITAEVHPTQWDHRWYVNLGTIIIEWLGI